ncbi:deferrochelatase/peroxidase EfeB (plasmid) [Paracoccus kondratievae]|uniref:iron uptake transporter deferrochelatase/peroxidase subunit n=1 Tax=Paracoccus TaxID=265 RepID=UPI000A0CC381|nr:MULTISPECIES: iron uptake transporter deferrochelatase/peroxidase subunit [Paracoccus]QFQ89882.1 deferrochelatase/peroxidase EfeB [Paracoccus kondratievae]SMG40836.1 deferrochelatase/peroxidase EfeB [Paracoccus sp. J56]
MIRQTPLAVTRRDLLGRLGLSVLGGTVAGGLGPLALPALADEAKPGHQVVDAPAGHAETAAQSVPFYGPHQAGILTPRPASGIFASFDIVVSSLDEFEQMLKLLTERAVFLTQGGEVPARDPKLPPTDSGLLGPVIAPDNLTITLGLGASLFERYDWLTGLKPTRLQRMTQFPNDALDPALCHGDLSLQFCANLPDTNIHALRDILKNLSEFLVMRWMIEGFVPPVPPAADGSTPSARNFLGFRDGSANPDANDAELMDQVVWTHGADEPEWAHGGSYQAVRVIRNFVERWDRAPLSEQENIFGRTKVSGAPLDAPEASEYDVPDYAADPDGEKTPPDSHIRLANPRTPESARNLMLRRPFNYSRGVQKNGQLDQGLLFIAYQADLEAGFIAVQNRLNGEPLEEYIKPVGGGYFFALPGVEAGDYLGSSLVKAARRS